MIVYRELDRLLESLCPPGTHVLELGGEPKGYLAEKKDICIVRSNIRDIPGLDSVFDAQDIPFADESFDLVFMVAMDYYVPSMEKMFTECHRVLKRGGVLVDATYVQENLRRQVAVQDHALHALSTEEYRQLFSRTGFDVHTEKIVNNAPASGLKRLIWGCVPQVLKLARSQWRIFLCEKH